MIKMTQIRTDNEKSITYLPNKIPHTIRGVYIKKGTLLIFLAIKIQYLDYHEPVLLFLYISFWQLQEH
jgi:hypothetical protein